MSRGKYSRMRPAEFRDVAQGLAASELRAVRDEFKDELVDMRGQISAAEADAAVDGEPIDPVWLHNVRTAMDYKQRLLEIADAELDDAFYFRFYEVCEEELDDVVMRDLIRRAER